MMPMLVPCLALHGGAVLLLVLAALTGGDGGRWSLAATAGSSAATALVGLGLLALAPRLDAGRRAKVRAAAALLLATQALSSTAGWWLAWADWEPATWRWYFRAVAAGIVAAVVLLVLAAGAWRRRPLAAVALGLYAVSHAAIPGMSALLSEWLGDRVGAWRGYAAARGCLLVLGLGGVLAQLAAHARAALPEPRAAAAGFRLARNALWALVAAMFAAPMVTLVLLGAAPQLTQVLPADVTVARLLKLVLLAAPLIKLAAILALVVGLGRIAGAGLDAMPRWLLALGAASLLWVAGLELERFASMVRLDAQPGRARTVAGELDQLTLAGPLAWALGLAVVAAAVMRYARRRDELLHSLLHVRRVLFGLGTAAFVLATARLTGAVAGVETLRGALWMMALAAIGMLLALAALASALDRVAAQLDTGEALPAARVV